jgi:bifunctional DNA-binding transcriptional regulator/antitoxin component of YhaV-PrlF toxin-antitoxin module
MDTYHVRVVEGGKIVLPAALRRKHGFQVGDTLVVEDKPQGVTILSLREAVAAAQAIVAKYVPADVSLVDELIADRQAEAARE